MKRIIIVSISAIIISMIVFSSCGKINTENLTTSETSTTELSSEQDTEPSQITEIKTEAYNIILDAYYEYLVMGTVQDIISDDYYGVHELTYEKNSDQKLKEVGYKIQDITSDGIPELFIGYLPGSEGNGDNSSTDIRALYTLVNGMPKLTFSGASRNIYIPLGENRFMNSGSGGAAYAVFGTYKLSHDGTELECEDYWFTHEKDGDFSEVCCYHNTTGEWDVGLSEETGMTIDEFSKKEAEIKDTAVSVQLTPFSEYTFSDFEKSDVTVHWKNEIDGELADTVIVDDSEYAVEVVFSCEKTVKDFKILALTANDIDENGQTKFDIEEKYSSDKLEPEKPLVVSLAFYGDIPNNGISYTDENGNTKRLAVSLSGEDGSLVLSEF